MRVIETIALSFAAGWRAFAGDRALKIFAVHCYSRPAVLLLFSPW